MDQVTQENFCFTVFDNCILTILILAPKLEDIEIGMVILIMEFRPVQDSRFNV